MHRSPEAVDLPGCGIDVVQDVGHQEVGTRLIVMTDKLDPALLRGVGAAVTAQDERMVVGSDQHEVS